MTAVMWLWVCILIREEIGKLPGKWATCLEAISKLYPHYMCIKLYPQNILHPYTCHYTTILLYHHQNFCRQKKTKTYLVDTFFRLKSRVFFSMVSVFFPWLPSTVLKKRVSSSPATLCCWRTESSPTFTQLHSAGSDWAAPPVLGPWHGHGTFS